MPCPGLVGPGFRAGSEFLGAKSTFFTDGEGESSWISLFPLREQIGTVEIRRRMLANPAVLARRSSRMRLERHRILAKIHVYLWGDIVATLPCDALLYECAFLFPVGHEAWAAFEELSKLDCPDHWLSMANGWRVVYGEPTQGFCKVFFEHVYPGYVNVGALSLVKSGPHLNYDFRGCLGRMWEIACDELVAGGSFLDTTRTISVYRDPRAVYEAGKAEYMAQKLATDFPSAKKVPGWLSPQQLQVERELNAWGGGMRAAACILLHYGLRVEHQTPEQFLDSLV